jgi:hypothetical protein
MDQGAEDLHSYRELRRRRTAWLVVSGFFWGVTFIFVAGAAWSLLSPGSARGDGEPVVGLIWIGVSLLVALWTRWRARAGRGRIAELAGRAPQWLPS